MDDFKANVDKYNSIQDLSSNDAKLSELSKEIKKEYYLFIIWLVISIIVLILTITTLLYKTEVSPLVWLVVTIFIIYCSFFIFNNLYHLLRF